MSELLARHRAVIPSWVGLYYDEPIEIVSGKGCRVTDSQGRSYLDFFAGILTNMLGYDVPEVREAVERQIATGVVHTSTLYLIRHQVELAEKIARLSGIEDAKVFFTNSGTEANETALLAALTARRANQVLAMRGSYHGRSFGAVVGHGQRGLEDVEPRPVRHCTTCTAPTGTSPRTRTCPTPTTSRPASMTCGPCWPARSIPADVACLLAEPVQGVGGFTMPPDGLLGAVQGGPRRARHPAHLGRGADRLGPHRRALLGHLRARDRPGRDDLRQGPGQRLRHRRRGGPRRAARRHPRQRHLHLRRQSRRHRRGQRHPGLPAVPRPAAQRRRDRRADHQRAPARRPPAWPSWGRCAAGA